MSTQNDGRASNGGARPGAGRPVVKATIRDGDGLMISQVYPDGGYVDLGRGKVRVEKRGNARIIIIAQPDGSEIRILKP